MQRPPGPGQSHLDAGHTAGASEQLAQAQAHRVEAQQVVAGRERKVVHKGVARHCVAALAEQVALLHSKQEGRSAAWVADRDWRELCASRSLLRQRMHCCHVLWRLGSHAAVSADGHNHSNCCCAVRGLQDCKGELGLVAGQE